MELKYFIEDSTIAEMLGRQNYQNPFSAILELVKNSYDAFSKNVNICFGNDSISIEDDGCGMSIDDINTKWMRVGISSKKYDASYNGEKRVLAGSKGIGRFALARLGDEVIVESRKKDFPGLIWKTNWNTCSVEECESKKIGTKITINRLRDRWDKDSISKLNKYLSKSYNNQVMLLNIIYDNTFETIKSYFGEENKKEFLEKITVEYDSKNTKVIISVDNKEFKKEAQEYAKEISISKYEKEVNIFDSIRKEYIKYSDYDFKMMLEELGDFSGNLFFSHSFIKEDSERFLYTDKKKNFYESGIVLYRNSFSIASYEGAKDWIGLGKRARKSPAAATHPTGSWRVRENQISGFINIDKDKNAKLKELQNRQGIEEDIYFDLFIECIISAIEEFERYRQSIIRRINEKNKDIDIVINDDSYLKIIEKKPEKLSSFSPDETKKLLEEINDVRETSKKIVEVQKDTESRYRYDVRILNILATSGLKASAIAHELENDRRTIEKNIEYIIKKLIKLEMWEEINSDSNTKYSNENIPYLLEKNRNINKKIINFIDTMLTSIQKDEFDFENLNIKDEINKIVTSWKNQYSWINFELNISDNCMFNTSSDILKVIFDNMILNSIQQNDNNQGLIISISITNDGDYLSLQYKDNGIGLVKKFINDPFKILDVLQTSRKNGHGLGMWIVNNSINMSQGKVINIDGHNGFVMDFILGRGE